MNVGIDEEIEIKEEKGKIAENLFRSHIDASKEEISFLSGINVNLQGEIEKLNKTINEKSRVLDEKNDNLESEKNENSLLKRSNEKLQEELTQASNLISKLKKEKKEIEKKTKDAIEIKNITTRKEISRVNLYNF